MLEAPEDGPMRIGLLICVAASSVSLCANALPIQSVDGGSPNGFEAHNSDTNTGTDISFNSTYAPKAPAWSFELAIELGHLPTPDSFQLGGSAAVCTKFGIGPCDLGWKEHSKASTSLGSFSFFFPILDGSGPYQVIITHSFNHAGTQFLDGSYFNINQLAIGLPEPGTLLLLCIGLMTIATRRVIQVKKFFIPRVQLAPRPPSF